MIRDITPNDIPWVMSLASERYKNGWDAGTSLVALTQVMRTPTAGAWRTDHAFLLVNCVSSAWYPKRVCCEVLALCDEEGHHWDAIKLLRHSIEWAKERGCANWSVRSDTHNELGALALRVGAQPAPNYMILWEPPP